MADASPPLQSEGGAGRFGSPVFPRSGSGSGSESEAELSQSLALTKTRSYGSTASVTAPLAERYVEHRVGDGDTLQGIALKYGVTMQQIKRANKLFTTDCIFLRKTLNIPVLSEKKSLFNGFNSLDSPENESLESCTTWDIVSAQEETSSSPSPQEPDYQLTEPEELSAKDFLHRLDLQIKMSTQAVKKLKEDDISLIYFPSTLYHSGLPAVLGSRGEGLTGCADDAPYATSSYHQ